MPKEYKFNPDTPASYVIGELRKPLTGNCEASTSYIDTVAATKCKTCMELALAVPNEHAAILDLYWHGELTHPDIRKVLIGKIQNPMMAFRLYITLSWLTDEEDKLLEEKFKGKLPAAEDELKKGIVTRAKQ
jgi:hypothetical protein